MAKVIFIKTDDKFILVQLAAQPRARSGTAQYDGMACEKCLIEMIISRFILQFC